MTSDLTSGIQQPDHDFPQMAVERGRIERCPRRVRGYADGELIFDTVQALYVWEVPYYPQYYIPIADVRNERRARSLTVQRDRSDQAVDHDQVVDDRLDGTLRFDWDALNWFEEDEPILGHPRNPYARVDVLRSHRHVQVELDGVLLAETEAPALLFETGLPTRYYIDRTDVLFEHLEPSDTSSVCPYKGVTSQYWSVRVGDELHADLAWSYQSPFPAVAAMAGMIAFYNEKVDITLDGRMLAR